MRSRASTTTTPRAADNYQAADDNHRGGQRQLPYPTELTERATADDNYSDRLARPEHEPRGKNPKT